MAYAVTTRSSLRTRIRERLIATFWADDEINRLIDEALKMWNALTGYHHQTSTVSLTSGTRFYDLTTNVANFEIFLGGELDDTHPSPTSLQSLDTLIPAWQGAANATISYLAPIGMDQIAIHPPPTATTSLYVSNVRTAILPTADGDFIQVGEEDLPAIVDCAHFLGTIKEGGAELKDALPLLQNFLKQASKYNSRLSSTSAYRNILGSGDQAPTHDPLRGGQ